MVIDVNQINTLEAQKQQLLSTAVSDPQQQVELQRIIDGLDARIAALRAGTTADLPGGPTGGSSNPNFQAGDSGFLDIAERLLRSIPNIAKNFSTIFGGTPIKDSHVQGTDAVRAVGIANDAIINATAGQGEDNVRALKLIAQGTEMRDLWETAAKDETANSKDFDKKLKEEGDAAKPAR